MGKRCSASFIAFCIGLVKTVFKKMPSEILQAIVAGAWQKKTRPPEGGGAKVGYLIS
jgi:hypothetical protein